MEHTLGKAEATKFLRLDGKEIENVSDVVCTVAASVLKSDTAALYGITVEGDNRVVCYTGNGPTSKDNAHFIACAWNCHDELLAAVKLAHSAFTTNTDLFGIVDALKAAIAHAEAE